MENYFNYFTEIEECFRRCRGTPTLLSTLDWALVESWKESNIPLEAVLNGIERTFQKFSKRPKRFQKINGLAYCSQCVFEAAEELSTALVEGGTSAATRAANEPAFAPEEIRNFLDRNAGIMETSSDASMNNGELVLAQDVRECALAVREIASREDWAADLEPLEQRLSALEDKLTAALTRAASVDLLAQIRSEADRGLAGPRRNMAATQIESLERQFLKKKLFEHYGVPRLSLFYL